MTARTLLAVLLSLSILASAAAAPETARITERLMALPNISESTQPSAAAAPKLPRLIVELKALRQKLLFNPRLRYLVMSQVLSQLITRGAALPAAMDLTLFIHTTILIPTDAALLSSGLLPNLKNPGASLNLFKSLSFNIIKGKKRFAKLKALPEGKSVALLMNNGKLFRHTVNPGWGLNQGTSVALALKGKKKNQWSRILDKNLHWGSFVAHGVDRLQSA